MHTSLFCFLLLLLLLLLSSPHLLLVASASQAAAMQLQHACVRPAQAPAIPASAQHATLAQHPLLHAAAAATPLARIAGCRCTWAQREWRALLLLVVVVLAVEAAGARPRCALPAMSGENVFCINQVRQLLSRVLLHHCLQGVIWIFSQSDCEKTGFGNGGCWCAPPLRSASNVR
jgi:hypothetical protein